MSAPADAKSQMRDTPLFTETLQIGIVVRDLEAAMRVHVERYGIGPWEIIDMSPANTTELTKDDKPTAYGMRIALTMVGSVQWELIEPTSGDNIYYEFLTTRGEGLHHVLVGVDSYRATIEEFKQRGDGTLMEGNYKDIVRYAYLPTDRDLGYVTEIFEPTQGGELNGLLVPDEVFPRPAE